MHQSPIVCALRSEIKCDFSFVDFKVKLMKLALKSTCALHQNEFIVRVNRIKPQCESLSL